MTLKNILMLSGSFLIGMFILATQLQTWEFEFEPSGEAWNVRVKLKYFYVFTYVDTRVDSVKYVTYIGSTGPGVGTSSVKNRSYWSGLVAMKTDGQYHELSRFFPFRAETIVMPFMNGLVEQTNKNEAFKSKLVIPFDLNPFTGIGLAFFAAGLLGILLLVVAKLRGISIY